VTDESTEQDKRKNVRRDRSSRPEPGASATRPSREPTGSNRRVAAQVEEPQVPSRSSRLLGAISSSFGRVRSFEFGAAKRAAIAFGKLTLVVAILAGAGATGRLVERYVRTSPAFAIRSLDVGGTSRLSREEAVRAAGIAVGANIFTMPPEDIRARLERHPWIASATVRRRLPGSIEIDVHERRAVAILVVDRSYLVGEDATVFKSLEPGDPTDLPIVTLADQARWLGDREALSALLLDVVSLAHDYARAGLGGLERLEEIHVEADDGLSLYVGQTAVEVRLGRAPYEQKLRRFRRLLEELRRREARPAYVRLDHERRPDRVVVRLRETLVPLPPIEQEAPSAPPVRAPRPRSRA